MDMLARGRRGDGNRSAAYDTVPLVRGYHYFLKGARCPFHRPVAIVEGTGTGSGCILVIESTPVMNSNHKAL